MNATITKAYTATPYLFGHMDQKPFALNVGDRAEILAITQDYRLARRRTFKIRCNGRVGFVGGGYNNIEGDAYVKMDTPDSLATWYHSR